MALIKSALATMGGLIPSASDYFIRSNYQLSTGNNTSLSLTGSGANSILWNVDGYSTFTSSSADITLYGSTDGLTWSSEISSATNVDITSYKYIYGIITGSTNIAIS